MNTNAVDGLSCKMTGRARARARARGRPPAQGTALPAVGAAAVSCLFNELSWALKHHSSAASYFNIFDDIYAYVYSIRFIVVFTPFYYGNVCVHTNTELQSNNSAT